MKYKHWQRCPKCQTGVMIVNRSFTRNANKHVPVGVFNYFPENVVVWKCKACEHEIEESDVYTRTRLKTRKMTIKDLKSLVYNKLKPP